MRLVRVAVAVLVAAVLLCVGFAVFAETQTTIGTVYETDSRGPKISFDDGPQMERAPDFRIFVGDSRKKAKWVKVNPLQYVGCAKGDDWTGTVCSKFALNLTSVGLSTRQTVLLVVVAAMVMVPVFAVAAGGKHD